MPTYGYICSECGHEFEEFQSISAEPIKICPKCNGAVERKIFGGVGLHFKGSGFYITDYKNKKSSSVSSTTSESKTEKSEKKAS